MGWDFSTEPEYAEQLAWAEKFVREECEPLDLVVKESHDLDDPVRKALIPPLQKVVKERRLPIPATVRYSLTSARRNSSGAISSRCWTTRSCPRSP